MRFRVLIDRTRWLFCGHLPGASRCISQGKTQSEARTNIIDAISGYLEACETQRANPAADHGRSC